MYSQEYTHCNIQEKRRESNVNHPHYSLKFHNIPMPYIILKIDTYTCMYVHAQWCARKLALDRYSTSYKQELVYMHIHVHDY